MRKSLGRHEARDRLRHAKAKQATAANREQKKVADRSVASAEKTMEQAVRAWKDKLEYCIRLVTMTDGQIAKVLGATERDIAEARSSLL
jgi:hypothetical protein